jgi:hypothetical protein
LQKWIRESLRDTEFQKYVDVGRFEEIPIEDRSKVEFRLRDQFRQRIKRGDSFDEDAAARDGAVGCKITPRLSPSLGARMHFHRHPNKSLGMVREIGRMRS